MSDPARDKYDEPTRLQKWSAAVVRLLDRNLVGPSVRAIRDLVTSRRVGRHDIAVKSAPATKLASSFTPLDNGGVYQRRCPTVLVRPTDMQEDRSVIAAQQPVTPLPFGVAEFEDAILCGEGVIWKKTSAGAYVVEDSLATATSARSILPLVRSADKVLHVDPHLKIRKLPSEWTYVLLRQPWDNNYGHWILESLPKVALVAEHHDLATLKFIVTRHSVLPPIRAMRQICLDSLAECGVRPDQIVWVGREAIQAERLLYALPMTVHAEGTKAPRIIRILEELRDKMVEGNSGPRRIYASRVNAGRRRLLNEPDLLRVLREFDVSIVDPGGMTFADQVRAFGNAELVVGNLGANLTNAVFSPRGVTMFAIASEFMPDKFFWDLANLKSGRYFSLHGSSIHPGDMSSDFVIDPDEVRAFLEEKVLAG